MDGSTDYLPRLLDGALAAALTTAPIVLLDGPRGAGKTTSARRLANSRVMLPRDRDQLTASPETYLAALEPPVLIDEWQLAGTDLLWALKGLVDDDPQPGRFILTGSVEPATYGPTYPLTARAVRLVMRPMTLAELDGGGSTAPFLRSALDGDTPVVTAGIPARFDLRWLLSSGFPATRAMPDARLFLDAYAGLVSQRAGEEGRDSSRLLRTMRVLATLESQAVPEQRIWEASDINKVTWKAYDDILQRTHLAAPSAAFESNRLKRLTSYPKRHFADTALALSLADLALEDLHASPTMAGHYLESFVLQQLRPQVDLVGGVLTHVRTSGGGREVDVVVEVGNRVLGLEVKRGSRPTSTDARHLVWLRDALGDRFTQGYVVHTGGDTYPLADRVWAVPIALVAGPTNESRQVASG
ncbi:DUF4143 domain-containing protein [Ornithinimicrobium sp. F0845]|uniref:ATP-binding protein n=1 Tax=Ornithinimicrobium sp. F0845 TaxID=2926412 RepID=UPI001FF58EFB|nr:DUF4143 domain-containing protein [Ornithinimicrobium sp. F0845]MCK0110673.1 DUF4143 domain-containing protein [Ornithinimicrobium sp. F0845]